MPLPSRYSALCFIHMCFHADFSLCVGMFSFSRITSSSRRCGFSNLTKFPNYSRTQLLAPFQSFRYLGVFSLSGISLLVFAYLLYLSLIPSEDLCIRGYIHTSHTSSLPLLRTYPLCMLSHHKERLGTIRCAT